MSTQFDTPILDLDRTDELPVLDVVAYEASLAANSKSLARTDTWSVEELRADDEPDDESDDEFDDEPAGAVPLPTVAKASVPAKPLTINVERILTRLAELEAEIVATHETNALLQRDGEVLRAELTEEKLRTETLQTDNARLSEARARSDEISQRREQQLRERTESIAALEKTLSNEKDIAAHLSRQLAAKLMDCEQTVAAVGQRDRTIEDLVRHGADLNERLQQEVAASAELTTRLAASEQSLHQSRALLVEHDGATEKRNAQLVQAQAQIRSLAEERDALQSASAQLDARAAELEQRNGDLAQLHGELVAARAEEQGQRMLLKDRTDELGTLRKKLNEQEAAIRGFEHAIQVGGEQVDGLMTQLRAACEERATMSVKLENARVRTKNLTEQIFSRDNRIAALEADIAVHTEALATIQRDVSRIGDHGDAEFDEVEHMLEPVGHDRPTLHLTGEVLTVGRTTDNDICIPSKLVSRRHARLLVGPTGVIIEDVSSTNGCYVNGEQVRQHLLQDGDVLELGDIRYRLRTRAAREPRKHGAKIHQLPSASRRVPPR